MWSAFSASHPKLVQAVSDWFSSGHTDHRTPLQLERERWILYHPSTGVFHRWMAILPAILAQMCIGSFYSSSIFNKYMDAHVWGSPGRNAGMFTICVAFYGLGTVLLGNWVGRNGAFKSVRRTLVLTPIGWLLASVASEHHQLWLLYCGYGVLHGLGCAHAYISTTSMLQQWYPELKGFMSGLAVCGAGVGSYCWTSLGRALMDPKGQYKYEPKDVQLVFAIVFLVMLSVSLPWMRNPPPGWKPQPVTLPDSSDQSVKAKLTRWLYGGAQAAASQAGAPVPGSFTTAQSPDSVTSISQAEAPGTIHTTSRDGGDDLKVKSLPWYDPSNWKSPKYCLSPDREYTFFQAVQQQEFKLTAIMVFGQFISGAVFLSSAADMTQNIFGYDANYAALVTSWMNLVNFTGRCVPIALVLGPVTASTQTTLVINVSLCYDVLSFHLLSCRFAWGFVTDKIGRKAFWLLSTFTQTFALALMTHAIPTQSFGLWLTCFLMIGSLYGGGFGGTCMELELRYCLTAYQLLLDMVAADSLAVAIIQSLDHEHRPISLNMQCCLPTSLTYLGPRSAPQPTASRSGSGR